MSEYISHRQARLKNQGLYDTRLYIKRDDEALKMALESTNKLKELYLANPEPLDLIASFYLKNFLKNLLDGTADKLTSYAGYLQAQEAYPEFTFNMDMFRPQTDRLSSKEINQREKLKNIILKDHHIVALMEKGNTIISKTFTPEQIKEEIKRRLLLDVVVSNFRFSEDNYFYLVETLEVHEYMESRTTIMTTN